MNLNKVFLIGRLTRDPEMRALPSGKSVTSFGLATDRFFAGKDGQKQQDTQFHNIVLFGRLAEIASQYLTKGSLTYIEGRLQTRSWQDASGQKKYRTEVLAERLQLGPRSGPGNPPAGGAKAGAAKGLEMPSQEEIPVIEEGEGEIDVKNIPF